VRDAGAVRFAGFTLIELLVAMAIVAVLSVTLVFVSAPGDAAASRTEARRLAALLELAYAEARATGRTIGWSSMPGGYTFWQKSDDGPWQHFPDDSPYRPRRMPAGTLLGEVRVDGQLLAPEQRLLMSPYGLNGAMLAHISGGHADYILRGGALGRISVQAATDAGDDAHPNSAERGIHAD
jgi:general secretion pathway protein H